MDFPVLVFKTSPDGSVSGALVPTSVEVEPSDSGEFKLGAVESQVGATGDQWKASQWAGSSVALLTTGVEPGDVKVTFDVTGQIDGPSAGAVMSVAVAAALNGDKIRQNVAMTGTINPDGSIGPVGGIPHKIQAAAGEGVETVLIPAGLRESTDLETGEKVDTVALGKTLGVDVREVDNIFVAYELFTGEKISDVPPPITEYRFTAEATAVLKEKIQKYLEIDDDAVVAVQASQVATGIAAFESGGIDVLKSSLEASAGVGADIETVLSELAKATPTSVSEVGALAVAYSQILDGLAAASIAGAELDSAESLDDIALVIRRNVQAAVMLDAGLDLLTASSQIQSGKIDRDVDFDSLTKFFGQAADAQIALFEAVVIPELAEAAQLDETTTKARLAIRDETYGRTLILDNVISQVENEESGLDLQYIRLGASIARYVHGAELIAKHYSLGAEIDPATFTTTGFKNLAGLDAMFKGSEDQVLRGAALLEKNNVDATPVLVFYEMAVSESAEALANNDAELILTSLS